MKRLSPLLLMLPTLAAADVPVRPQMFQYDAPFARCIADPDARDLAETCATVLTDAYILKRAVARAVAGCDSTDPATCDAAFAAQGLPAVAYTIARDAGCTTNRIPPTGAALPADHCITIAADVLLDEGVVPLDGTLACDGRDPDCADLARVNATLWARAAATAEGADPDRPDPYAEDCAAVADTDADADADDIAAFRCRAQRNAALWADLTRDLEGTD